MGTKNNPGIYDCYAKAGPDEPIFTFRANDPMAPDMIDEWVLRATARGVPLPKRQEAATIAEDMRAWKRQQARDSASHRGDDDHG